MTAPKQQTLINFGSKPSIWIPWWHPVENDGVDFTNRAEAVHYFRQCLGVLPRELLLAMHEAVFQEMTDVGANEGLGNDSVSDYTPERVFVPESGDPLLQ